MARKRKRPATVPVIVVRPGEDPVVEHIPPTLKGMQAVVGGYVELCRVMILDTAFLLWCNEDARALQLQPNRAVPAANGSHRIVGAFFLSADFPGDLVVGFGPTYQALLLPIVASWPRL